MHEGNAESWVCVLDGRRGELWRSKLLRNGRRQLQRVCVIDNDWREQEHEHGRPSPRLGKGGHTYASLGHEEDTLRRYFAKTLVDWLDVQVGERSIRKLAVFAPPRLIGELRKTMPSRLAAHLEEREGRLVGMGAAQLAEHLQATGLH